MHSTRVARHVEAPRSVVYQALLNAQAIARWRVPDGMSSHVHEFDARVGGRFRVSLRYQQSAGTGKSTQNSDTYQGYFAELVPDEKVVEMLEFETADAALASTMTTTLTDADPGTNVVVVHAGIPDAIPADANEIGTRMALDNLAELVEGL